MTSAPTDPMIDRLVDGRYEVVSRIARGGMATVYVANDLRLDRRVAIKIMHGHLADDEAFRERFVQEARSAARLAHPNVVSVFDQGQHEEMAFMVMEYLPGMTLRDLLKDYGRLTTEQTLDIMEAVLGGLAAAHKAGIVHRDVKPENVLLADDGRIKIGDFGLARAASANTATGQALLGTIAYLSPELLTRGVADARSDLYAAGIMMYEMLVGEQPYLGEQPMQIAFQHANETVPAPSVRIAGIPGEVDDLVAWATAKSPDDRPHDARELLEQLLEAEAAVAAAAAAASAASAASAAAAGSHRAGGAAPRGSAAPPAQTTVMPAGMMTGLNGRLAGSGAAGAAGVAGAAGAGVAGAAGARAGAWGAAGAVDAPRSGAAGGYGGGAGARAAGGRAAGGRDGGAGGADPFGDETGRYDAHDFGDDDVAGYDDESDDSETQVLRPQKARGSRRAAARAAKARAAAGAAGGAAAAGGAGAAGARGGAATAGALGGRGAAGLDGAAAGAGRAGAASGAATADGTRSLGGASSAGTSTYDGRATGRAPGTAEAQGTAGGTTAFAAGFGAPGPHLGTQATAAAAGAGAPRQSPARAASATSDRHGANGGAAEVGRPGGSVQLLKQRIAKRRRRGWFIVLLVLLLVAAGGGAGWYFSSGPGGHVTVPTLTAQTPADATATLQGLGLQVGDPESTTSPTVPAGSLIGTDPGDGQAVPNGSSIALIVSAGPAQLTVPPLVGSMQDVATAAVAGLFTVAGSQGQFAGDVAAGTVMQALGADGQPLGATYGEQQPITFIVSLGGVPDVVGKSPDDAAATLKAANLESTTGSSDYSETIPEGNVISVGLPPSPIVPGNTVTLNTSKGPAPVPVPDVAGKAWVDAKASLQNAGFTVTYSNNNSGKVADAFPDIITVQGTDPAAGTTIARGSTVSVSFNGLP